MNQPTADAWWERHPAHDDLVEIFKGSTRSPGHLAFLALTGLRDRGWEVRGAVTHEEVHAVLEGVYLDATHPPSSLTVGDLGRMVDAVMGLLGG